MSKQWINRNSVATLANSKRYSKSKYSGVEQWRFWEWINCCFHRHTHTHTHTHRLLVWNSPPSSECIILFYPRPDCKHWAVNTRPRKKATQLEAQRPWIANSRHFSLCWSHLDLRSCSWDLTAELKHKVVCRISLPRAFFFFFFSVQKECTAGWHSN